MIAEPVVDGDTGSQFGQDRFLDTYVFAALEGGVFLDVGAYDGVSGSNSLLFEEERGWTGLLVEPDTALAQRARELRSSPCLEVAVGAVAGEADFLRVTQGYRQMGGLLETYKADILAQVRAVPTHVEEIRQVDIVTFVELVEKLDTDHIDLISLDIEGGEDAALSAFPFDKVSVGAWSIENVGASADLADTMRRHGYGLVRRLGVDEIYVPEERVDRVHQAEGWDGFDEGVELLDSAHYEAASAVFLGLIEADDSQADAWGNLGIALRHLDRIDESLVAHRRAIGLAPQDGIIRRGLQRSLVDAGLFAEVLDLGLQLEHPEEADLVFIELARFETAYAAGEVAAALAACERRVSYGYSPESAAFDRAATLLAAGRTAEGLQLFEARRHVGDNFPTFEDLPEWQGEPLADRGLLVVGEQGFGDYVFFARWLRELPRSATLGVACPGPLARLFAETDGIDHVFDLTDPIPLQSYDFWVPMGSLASLLGCREPAPPWTPQVPASSTERARAIVDRSNGDLHVGLVWTGRDDTASLRRRHLEVESLAPLFQIPGVSWYSIAKGQASDDVERVADHYPMVDVGSSDADLADCAGVCSELDLMISVCTVGAHLAASLGTPTWILLHDRPFWLWGPDRSDSDWYPTVRLFRQTDPGDWAPVVGQVAHALTDFVLEHSGSSDQVAVKKSARAIRVSS